MAKVRQLMIAVENRPGAVAEIAAVLGHVKVNLFALSGIAQGTGGSVRIVVSDPRRAKDALNRAGMTVTEDTVEQIELANTPGALAKYLGRLAAKSTNLSSIYATAAKGARKAIIVHSGHGG